MAGGQRGQQTVLPDLNQVNAGGGCHTADEGGVQLAGGDPFQAGAGGAAGQLGRHRRPLLGQRLQDTVQPVTEAGAAAQPEHPRRGGGRRACRDGAHALGRGEGGPGFGQQPAAGFGQADRPAGAVEETDAQLAFQAGDLLAHGGLADRQRSSRPAEVQVLRYRDEVLQLPQLHPLILPLGMMGTITRYLAARWAIWIRLPQVSSSTAVVTGPMSVGLLGKAHPQPAQPLELGVRRRRRRMGERDAVGDQRLLERPDRRVLVGFETSSMPSGSAGTRR